MNCSSCGATVDDQDRFCGECGTPIAVSNAANVPASPSVSPLTPEINSIPNEPVPVPVSKVTAPPVPPVQAAAPEQGPAKTYPRGEDRAASIVNKSGNGGRGQISQPPTPYIVDAMNRWSGAFSKLLLPSRLGTKATIRRVMDEGAKVLSMGVYMGRRTAVVDAIPYDGSTYEGHTMKDESSGTLWAYEALFPDSFSPVEGEKFIVSLGHVFKCHQCRGQGRVRCQTCGGKVRWTKKNLTNDGYTEYTCNCGDGKQDCPDCTGFGQRLKVLRVGTRYDFDEKKAKEYSGKLPESLLMQSSGNVIFQHTSEFEKRVIAEAIDGFEPDEFTRLMTEMHGELKSEIYNKVVRQLSNPAVLHGLIDNYFRQLPNPVAANKRLQEEVLPIRMKCEVTDVPVKGVAYEYKGKEYSLYVYGDDGKIWVDGAQPFGFTWKIGLVLGLVALLGLALLLAR